MKLIAASSLAATVDGISEALFTGTELSAPDREAAARFIAARQGRPGCYHGLFAPLPDEPQRSLTLFTGERIVNSQAGSAHILGQEALRVLLLLAARDAEARAAAKRAQAAMAPRLAAPENAPRGMY